MNLDKKSLQDATVSCLDNGAGILTLRSVEEENFLRGELEKNNLNNIFYWLGMRILLLMYYSSDNFFVSQTPERFSE